MSTQQFVDNGQITFHELAEAHAKLELEIEYLGQGARPGAHDIAIDREMMLQSQRPMDHVVVTVGSNRVLRTLEEVRQFYLHEAPPAAK